MFEMLPWAVLTFDKKLKIVYANAAARNILGFDAIKSEIFLHDIDWVDQSGELLSLENNPVTHCFKNGEKIFAFTIGFSSPSEKQITWMEAHCIPELEKGNQQPEKVIFTFVTKEPRVVNPEIRNPKAELENKLEVLTTTLDNLNEAILVVNHEGTVVYTNRGYAELFKPLVGDIVDWTFEKMASEFEVQNINGQLLAPEHWPFARILNGQTVSGEKLKVTSKTKNISRYLQISGGPVKLSENRYTLSVISASDITQQETNIRLLQENEQSYHKLFLQNPQPMWIYDRETLRFLEVNNAALNHYGYSREEFMAMTLKDIRPKEDIPELLKNTGVFAPSFHIDGNWRHLKKNEEVIEVEIVSHSLTYQDRKARHVMAQDVTERKLAEKKLTESQEILSLFIQHAPASLAMFDCDMKYLAVSNRWLDDYNLSGKDFIGASHYDIFPEISDEWKAIHQRGLNGEFIRNDDDRFVRLNGTIQYLKWEIRPWYNADREVGGIIIFTEDITERKEIEKQMVKLNKAIEQSPVAIIITDTDANITYASPAFKRITGYTKEEVLGKNVRVLKSGKNKKELYTEMWEAITSGELWEGELINKKKDGTFYWEYLSVTPLIENENQITGYLAVQQDITETRKNEQEIRELNANLEHKVEERTLELIEANEKLVKAKETAEEANKAKSLFLANMSHEIRTPLNSIIGFSELLYNSVANHKERFQVKSIRNSGRSLLNIINDILDLSKVEAGKIIIEKEPLDVFKLVREVGSMFEQKAAEKKLELFIESDTELTTSLLLDETRLRQILFNLVGNAIKFTEQGKIIIHILHEERENGHINLQFRIKDTGIGISEHQLEAIFEPFVQHQGQVQKIYGGTGLGLAISKRMTEAMGGEISVKSVPGKGSEFTVTLKNILKADLPAGDKENNLTLFSDIRFYESTILIVDDIRDNRKLLLDALESTGARLLEAENGDEAVLIAMQEKPDIILMDLRMPVMDGWEAAKELKQSPATSKIPCIAVSASVKIGNSGNEIPEKFEEFLMKPVVFDQLFGVLSRYLNRAKEEKQVAAVKVANAFEMKKEWSDELKQIVTKELLPLYHLVMKEQVVDDMEEFGRKLISAGQKFNDDLLENTGNKICEYADLFDVDKLTQTMHEFQFLINGRLKK